jgi:hypothetical protein
MVKNRRSTKKHNNGQGILKRKALEAQNTREFLAQLDNVFILVNDVLGELQGGTSSKKLKVVAEVVKIAKNQVEKNTKSLAPLSGQEYASNRLKLEEKRAEAIKSGGIEDSALHQAQAFVRDNKESLKPSSKSTKTSTCSSTKIATVTFGQDRRSSKSS